MTEQEETELFDETPSQTKWYKRIRLPKLRNPFVVTCNHCEERTPMIRKPKLPFRLQFPIVRTPKE